MTVRAYKVDLETYFRKMHLARGVEGLDIALIDPDKTFEFKVPNYAKHQELESAIEVPLPGRRQGRRDGRHRQQQDARSHHAGDPERPGRDRQEFARRGLRLRREHADRQAVGRGAKLLVSNGKQVFAEETTGEDGVFQKSYKELKDAGDVRVFAVADGNVASNVVGLQGVGVARGLADKGYIYTDRPAYRAGQIGPRPRLPAPRGRRRLHDREGQEVHARGLRQPQPARAPGGGQARASSAASTPISCCRRPARRASTACSSATTAAQNYQGTFLVHEYQLEPVRLVVDTPRHGLLPRRGDRGDDPRGRSTTARRWSAARSATNWPTTASTRPRPTPRARSSFKLPTREFSETQVLPLVVTLPERNLQTAVNFVLAAQGFSIGVEHGPAGLRGRRDVRGQRSRPSTPRASRSAQKLTLKVLEQTTVEGKVGERLVEEHPLETAGRRRGPARRSSSTRAAATSLRAEGTDRFENPITGQYAVQISDDEDTRAAAHPGRQHTLQGGRHGRASSSTGAKSRPWPWSRSRAPGCSTTSWSS